MDTEGNTLYPDLKTCFWYNTIVCNTQHVSHIKCHTELPKLYTLKYYTEIINILPTECCTVF